MVHDGKMMAWRKSMASGTGNCVQVAAVGRMIYVRDSKTAPSGSVLAFTEAEWDAFLSGVRAGEFGVDSLRSAKDGIMSVR